MAAGTLALMGLKLGAQMAPTVIAGMPGKMERQYRKHLRSVQERLAGGRGGMAAGQREQLRSEAVSGIQAQQQQDQAQLARGTAMGQADSGARQAALASSQRAAQAARQQAESSIRAQDLALGNVQRQQLQAGYQNAIRMGQWRKQMALDEMHKTGPSLGQGKAAGAGARNADAAEIAKALPMIMGG